MRWDCGEIHQCCWNWKASKLTWDSELFITANPSSRVAVKNRISGLNAIRCSSVLINVNSYTHGKEINNVNTDWFQAVVWKPANLEGAAAASRKETKYGCAGHCHCAPKTVVLGRTGSGCQTAAASRLCTPWGVKKCQVQEFNWSLTLAKHSVLGLWKIFKVFQQKIFISFQHLS